MIPSGWKTVTLDYDRDTEFSGDDADRFSELLDIDGHYEFVTVLIPLLSPSAVVSPYVQEAAKIAPVPRIIHARE